MTDTFRAAALVDTPPGWGRDALSQFLDAARIQTFQAVADHAEHYDALAEVDGVFRTALEQLGGDSEQLAGAMFLRSHGRYLGATSLALSGLAAEAYTLLNRSLVAALQGVFVAGSAERQKLWVNRNDDDAAHQQMRVEFTSANLRRHFRQTDPATAMVCETLLRRTSDHSDHPNTYADPFRRPEGDHRHFNVTDEYFVHGGEVQRYCLRTAAQVGICVLSMFFYVFGDRYRESDIPERLTKLRKGH
jgi:hypothetical protein